jgi:hypothetical protein
MGGGVLDWDTVALLDRRPLDKRTLAVLSAGLKIRWRCWMGGRQLDERKLTVLDRQESAGLRYDTVRRQLDECTLAVLDGRESAGLANGGTVASLDG